MQDRNNTIAGWVLFAGIVALGATLVTGEVFKNHEYDSCEEGKGGYCPPEVAAAGGETGGSEEAAKPVAFYLASADIARGENVFKKCTACHNATQGGANALGPNLWGTMGKPHANHPGFAYSDALKGVPGTWTWEAMDAWLASPRNYAPGTKMTFAGLGDPQDRADLMLWLNAQGSNIPVPPPPAEEEPAADEGAADNAVANEEAPAEAEAAPAA